MGVTENRLKLLTVTHKLPLRFLVLFAAGFVDKGKLVNIVTIGPLSQNFLFKCGQLIQGFLLIHNILVSLFSHLYSVLGKIIQYLQYNIQRLYNGEYIFIFYWKSSLSRAWQHFSYQATRSHCNVWNFAPSISAAIGDFSQNRVVWQTFTSLASLVRILLALQYKYLMKKIMFSLGYITNMACVVSFILNWI